MFKQYFMLPRAVHILCLGTFVNRAGSFFLVFLTIYIGDKLGFGPRFATFCLGVFGFGSLLGSLLGGQLADQFGRRVIMLSSLIGGALILSIFPLVHNKWFIPTVIFIYAMTIDMYRPAASAMISDLIQPEQRSTAFGLMYIAINLGFTCGAGVGGMLAAYSFNILFLGDAATTFAYGLIILFLIRESMPKVVGAIPVIPVLPIPDATTGSTANKTTSTEVSPPSQPTAPPVSIGDAVRHILGDWPFLAFCLSCLLIAVVFMQGMSTLPLYMKSLDFAPNQYGWIISLNGILIVICQVPLTTFLARFDRVRVIALGSIVTGIGFSTHAFARTGYHFAGAVVIWTLGELMQAPFTQAVVSDLAPVNMRARYMGVFTMCFSSAMMFGAPLGGFVLDRFGGKALWLGGGCISLVSALILTLAYRAITARRWQPAT